MSNLLQIICECIHLANNLNPAIGKNHFIRKVIKHREEKELYVEFAKFGAACNSSLLAVLFTCGLFRGNKRLREIACDIVAARNMIASENLRDYAGLIDTMFHENV